MAAQRNVKTVPNEGARRSARNPSNDQPAPDPYQNTGARPKVPQANPKPRRTITTIPQSLDIESYDQYHIPRIAKEYRIKFEQTSDKTKREIIWKNQPPAVTGRRRAQDVVQGPVGETLGRAKEAKTPLSAFELFITPTMFGQLVGHTNVRIQSVRSRLSPEFLADSRNCYVHETNEVELRALIGLCYLRAMLNVSKQVIKHLWGPDGHHGFAATMSMNRFAFLISLISFDDPNTREERKKSDKFAVMRDFFEAFSKNCS